MDKGHTMCTKAIPCVQRPYFVYKGPTTWTNATLHRQLSWMTTIRLYQCGLKGLNLVELACLWMKDYLKDLHSKHWIGHMKESYVLACQQNALILLVIFVYATCLHMVPYDLVMLRSILTYYYHRIMCIKMIVHLFYVVIITVKLFVLWIV